MLVVEVRNADLMQSVAEQAKAAGVENAAIVSLIGAVDSFTVSTMPEDDPTADVLTEYKAPAEMHGVGEIVKGVVHIHATLAVAGDKAISGHLHKAQVGARFARVYVQPC